MTENITDRLASERELGAARRRMLKRNGGPGIIAAARRLGVSFGHLSTALTDPDAVAPARRLKLSDLRRMFQHDLAEQAK